MSVYDNVAFGPRTHRMTKAQMIQQVETLAARGVLADLSPGDVRARGKRPLDLMVTSYLRLAGLWEEVRERLRVPASRLSMGQQQRLALARTLAVEPEVVLADEATSALDPISTKLIESQFKLLKPYYTIVMVTHILRQARRLADYVLFVYMGELVEHGPADEVFNAPRDPRTRAYVSGEIS